ncbi:MAG: ABC transporter ATP-binding protein [Phycisphaeraceae bacterium]|nr:ABC transporter ATP-binding protein [Phycisphaeraceae bacterium]
MSSTPFLQAQGLHKYYRSGTENLHVLRGVDLDVNRGEWLAVLGASGSGKSTLLHLLGGLDRPGSGTVRFEGMNVFEQSSAEVDRYRNLKIGFVFQFYHLLPELTAIENLLLAPMITTGGAVWPGMRGKLRGRAIQLLERMGLSNRMDHRPAKLSGGERQRVAIARSLMNQPAVLLADEPTGNLDTETGKQILEVFRETHATGQTIVMVTHDPKVADAADRRVVLEAGKLVNNGT